MIETGTDVKGNFVAKAVVFSGKNNPAISRSLEEDKFITDYKTGKIIEPPFNLFTLSIVGESSSIFQPCLDAMAVNIEALGYRIVPRPNIYKEGDDLDNKTRDDIYTLENFYETAVLEGTFIQLKDHLRRDLETTGNSYMEVIPNFLNPAEPAGLGHLQSWNMRLRKSDEEYTNCFIPRIVKSKNDKWEIMNFPYRKRFRRYVMVKDYGHKKSYFKELWDPRVIDYRDGEVLAEEWQSATPEQRMFAANAVIHQKLYCPRSPYGLPRFIGNLFNIYGSRQAEEINYMTFKCNNVPALVLLATNVQLTSASIDRIKEFVEERIQGDNNYSTILLIEGEPITEGLKDPGTMKIELKPLTDTQHTDAMFVQYMDRADEKTRQAFRLPPIFIGKSQEYNRATADASRRLAEEQIFLPERNTNDSIHNTTLVPMLGVSNAVLHSNTPNVTDNYELTQLLAVAERSGGLTPSISRFIVEDVLGQNLPRVDDSINPNLPFTLTMLREQLTAETEAANVDKFYSDEEIIKQLDELENLVVDDLSIKDDVVSSINKLRSLVASSSLKFPKLKGKSKNKLNVEKFIVEEDKTTKMYNAVFKVEGEQRIIGGAVLVPGVVDLQGDIYDGEAVREAAYFWLENYMNDENHGIKLMHEGETIENAARPIQSFVTDDEMEFVVDVSAADDNHPSQGHETITYPKDTWLLYTRINEEHLYLWDDFKNGKYIGWSIGGVALVQQLKNKMKESKQ